MINPNKTKTIKELGAVDISGIKNLILNIPEELWEQENKSKPNKFIELDQTQHIIFKFVEDLNDCTKSYELPIWGEWKEHLLPLLNQAVHSYAYPNGRFSRIMLAKLKAGGTIKLHKDGGREATFPHKIHIPIKTNSFVKFFVNPKFYVFEEGKAYEVNNYEKHYAENLGEEDRIHLIFEYFNNDLIQKS